MVRGRKPIQERQVRGELHEALAEVRNSVPCAVAGSEIDVVGGIHAWAFPRHPAAVSISGWISVENRHFRQRGFPIGKQETVQAPQLTLRTAGPQHVASAHLY